MRPDWDEYLMLLAFTVSLRSEDPNTKVGCVCVDEDHKVLATGYNGLLTGKVVEPIYWKSELRLKTVIHAEANAVLRCPPKGIHLLVSTVMPCLDCLKLAAVHGVKEILYAQDYHRTPDALQIAEEFFKLKVRKIEAEATKEWFKLI